jgi:hypothetical protein
MTTTIALLGTDTDALNAAHGAAHDIDYSHDPNRSTTLILIHEVLSRVRMREKGVRVWPAGHRPAREVAMSAAKRRERF